MPNAFAYLRVSGKGQLDGDGFPRQRAAIEAYAVANGLTITGWYEERGVCGENDLAGRPALAVLFEDAQEQGVQIVIVEALHRFARMLMVQETILADIKKRGWQLVSATEPDLMQEDPSRVMMRQIFGVVAQYEKAMIVDKLRVARERMKQRTGRCEGRKPYGETALEQATVADILRLHGDGASIRFIADVLNSKSVPTRSGGRWTATQVHRILRRQ